MYKLFLACWLALAAVFALAAEAQPTSANPALEEKVMAISHELRCLVCQNQTIADSNAELAVDLRNQVREKLQQGMSEKDIVAYMVQRYGDFVLYRPPVKGTTWLLWFGPFMLLIGGIVFLGLKLRRRDVPTDTLPQAEMQRAAALLSETPDKETK